MKNKPSPSASAELMVYCGFGCCALSCEKVTVEVGVEAGNTGSGAGADHKKLPK